MSTATDDCREVLAPFCLGNGCDLGFGGGRPIRDSAICVDREPGHPHRREESEPWPTHLVWDVFSFLPFREGVLDYCYSSHCLEDAIDTSGVLKEWVRVLKVGGKLVLFLPDQRAYEACCRASGGLPNQAHKHADFSLDLVKAALPENCRVVFEQWPFPGNPYSFALVAEKIARASDTLIDSHRDKMYED